MLLLCLLNHHQIISCITSISRTYFTFIKPFFISISLSFESIIIAFSYFHWEILSTLVKLVSTDTNQNWRTNPHQKKIISLHYLAYTLCFLVSFHHLISNFVAICICLGFYLNISIILLDTQLVAKIQAHLVGLTSLVKLT